MRSVPHLVRYIFALCALSVPCLSARAAERAITPGLSTPRCGSGPKCHLEGRPPPPPMRPKTPPPPAWAAPSRITKRSQGKRDGAGWGGKGWGLREGSSTCNGGDGGPFKGQLGPDPHLGALDTSTQHCVLFPRAVALSKLALGKLGSDWP